MESAVAGAWVNSPTVFLTISAALLCDLLLGEPSRYHPLVGFGRYAGALERKLNTPANNAFGQMRVRGIVATALATLPFVVGAFWVSERLEGWGAFSVDMALLSFSVGWRSLIEHARRVHKALMDDDLARARNAVGMMVSRDTHTMSRADVIRATIESTLENGCDAFFGALFWFVVAGAPGVVGYRLINTLDAMWGYRDQRFFHFGWSAARMDDLMNYVPARLTALTYALAGDRRSAFQCWRRQGCAWDSPNAGPVMAAGAGALDVALGGVAHYHGAPRNRPHLGGGRSVEETDIERALRLVNVGALLWVLVIGLTGYLGAAHA